MGVGIGVGIGGRRYGGGVAAPPSASDILAYYEAATGTTLSSSPSANYGKLDAWTQANGAAGSLLQATSGLQPKKRTTNPLVYLDWIETTAKLSHSTISINRRDSSFFCLATKENITVRSVAEDRTLMYLGGGDGELFINHAVSSAHGRLAWKDGSGTYYSSLLITSSTALYGVTLTASGITLHLNDESETLAASPLTAGNSTGFDLFIGSLSLYHIGGFESVVWYSSARDAGELADVQAWAKARGAVYRSDRTDDVFSGGASRALGYQCEGMFDVIRRISLDAPKRLMYKAAFGGNTIAQAADIIKARLALQSDHLPDTGLHSSSYPQMVLLEIPTADTTAGTASATQITALTNLRRDIRTSGYDLVVNALAPSASPSPAWDAAKLTIMGAINTAMAALDSRLYGDFIPLPTEASDASNTTYFPDGLHYSKALYDVWYALDKPYFDTRLAVPVTSLKGSWEFNGNRQDSSRYRRDMIALNTPTYTTGLNGKQCLVCTASGNNAVKSITAARNYDYIPLSIMFWFKTSSSADIYLVNKWSNTGGSKIWFIRKASDGTLQSGFTNSAGINGGGSYADGAWHVAALVADATSVRLYAGPSSGDASALALIGTGAWPGTPDLPLANSGIGELRFGNFNDTNAYDVHMQGCRIWNVSKTLVELQAEVA